MRDVEDSEAIVGPRVVVRRPDDVVVVVQREPGTVAGKKVRLADLIVLEDAVGVADATAKAMREALGPFDDTGVVPTETLGYLPSVDGLELREQPKERRARQGRRRRQRRRDIGIPEERIRHLLIERRSKRQIFRIELVDIYRRVDRAAERQVVAPRADIADVDRHPARQL